MTTVATMASPGRLPFASLGGTRLRNMTNMKNKQNALASTTASALKRHAPAEFDDVDSENIDPLMFSTPSKKGRTFDFDMTKSNETPLFAPAPPQPAQYVQRAQAAGLKRKAEDNDTPAAGIKRRAEPSSAPAPAGRSPKHKRVGILSRRRMTTSPFTRVHAPSSSAGESANGLPFSIDAALAGTVPKFKSKSTNRNGWQFDIHEDTPDDEMANLMEHSTCTLDISDDECSSSKGDKDNKENIPPTDSPAAVASATQVTATRRDMMTDETREPLGDLEAKEFYAEGCDASSCIIVAVEDSSEQIMDKLLTPINTQGLSSPPHSRAVAVTEAQAGWEDVIARFAAKTTTTAPDADLGIGKEVSKDAIEIQIWESESAKGDDDADAQEFETDGANPQSLLA
ncbi:MAG: hypothetical protein ASARMPREDX12_002964 [Alectoria sarmentosa]|nr:MAG: hypothetical protein ASARMPREDX12_002964 [Alectoria sarmentosa]